MSRLQNTGKNDEKSPFFPPYRFAFNGKENDNEVKGTGNQQDYGMRVYDPRLGKFLSVDPLTRKYPWYTPYQFAGNKPTIAIDIDGLEEGIMIRTLYADNTQQCKLYIADDGEIFEDQKKMLSEVLGTNLGGLPEKGTLSILLDYSDPNCPIVEYSYNPISVVINYDNRTIPEKVSRLLNSADAALWSTNGLKNASEVIHSSSTFIKIGGLIATATLGPEIGIPILESAEIFDNIGTTGIIFDNLNTGKNAEAIKEGVSFIAKRPLNKIIDKSKLDAVQKVAAKVGLDSGVDLVKDNVKHTKTN